MHWNSFLKFALAFQAIATVGIWAEAWITQSLCGLVGKGQLMRWEMLGGSSQSSASYHMGNTHPQKCPVSLAVSLCRKLPHQIHQLMQREVKDTGSATQSRNPGTTAVSGKNKKITLTPQGEVFLSLEAVSEFLSDQIKNWQWKMKFCLSLCQWDTQLSYGTLMSHATAGWATPVLFDLNF